MNSKSRHGGSDRVSTKAKFAGQFQILGKVLAGTREAAGLKQSEVAARLGLPASHLSKVENGTRRLDVIELMQLSTAIGVSATEIIAALETELRKPR